MACHSVLLWLLYQYAQFPRGIFLGRKLKHHLQHPPSRCTSLGAGGDLGEARDKELSQDSSHLSDLSPWRQSGIKSSRSFISLSSKDKNTRSSARFILISHLLGLPDTQVESRHLSIAINHRNRQINNLVTQGNIQCRMYFWFG